MYNGQKDSGQNVLPLQGCHGAAIMENLYQQRHLLFIPNFRVAAGLDTGSFRGPSFHDGDFYKTLEAVAAMYAVTKDKKLDKMMDEAIAVIGKGTERRRIYLYQIDH